jgi:diguanylate cyclase (GGDEF)-like protein
MFSSWLGVPLKDEDQHTIGVLCVLRYNVNNDFDDDDQKLISYVAQQISSSIQRKQQSQELEDAHKELQEANNQLESRVEERTRALSRANEHLQQVIQERMKIEEKLAHDAFHDSLTALPNRSLFLDRLDKAIQNRRRNKEHTFAVLFLDLDRFKIINDSLGHHIGDLLLIEIAKKLSQCVRPGDTVARLGGDEFAILLLDRHTSRAAKAVAKRIAQEISAPFELEGNMVFSSTSIGINLCKGEVDEAADVLRDADTAMYAAKAKGKAQTAIFDKSMYEQAVKQLQLESELRRALEKEQIEVFYQPIIALETDQIIAFEALARWHHPKLGWVSPGEFIPIAEETGLISDIGLFIMDQALSQTIIWQNTNKQFKNLMISVNLSSYQLADIDLYQDSMQIIQSHNFPKDKLRLEVTESLLIDNFDSARQILNSYAEAGIKILLDDFGTGYSSLSYLHHFPIHVLKVDRSFVMEMDKRDENMAIISTIKTLAESLNMEVVAEGIEENHQRQTLKNMGFEYGQGFYFAKPMPAKEITRMLKWTVANGDALKLILGD